jgi:hypothetical protein
MFNEIQREIFYVCYTEYILVQLALQQSIANCSK